LVRPKKIVSFGAHTFLTRLIFWRLHNVNIENNDYHQQHEHEWQHLQDDANDKNKTVLATW